MARNCRSTLAAFPEYERTGFGWPVAPDHLGILLRELKDRYGESLPPLYITESGASFPEPDHVTGPIPDADRISYLAAHLGQALEATSPGGIAHDVELLGYYVWTLHGQLRMGGRILPALRPGARGFRHPPAHPEGLVLLVPGPRAGAAGLSRRLLGLVCYWLRFARLMRLARSISWRKCFFAQKRDNYRDDDQQKNEPAHGELL